LILQSEIKSSCQFAKCPGALVVNHQYYIKYLYKNEQPFNPCGSVNIQSCKEYMSL